jgi:hypothetical protein
MFAIFRKRAGKLMAEMVALQMKEADLIKRAKDHAEAAEEAIDALVVEINQAQMVADYLEERYRF